MVYAFPDAIEQICNNDGEEGVSPDSIPTSEIQHFYEGANVFITGGTGFVGMVLVEKLLRSCPGLNKLFLLIRSRKGKTAEERLAEMFRNALFARLLESRNGVVEKVRIVCGDVEEENLGISSGDAAILKNDINVVIHVAATVRFDEHLRKAYSINVTSLKTLLDLAQSMKNLKAFVHVSTAFVQVHRNSNRILEAFYPSPSTEVEMEALLRSADDHTIACLTNQILGKMANTYVFTKAIAEDILRRKLDVLPIAIYRPSIVLSTYSEPVRGWTFSFQSAAALVTGIGLGVLRVIKMCPNKRADLIPVDKCAAALIVLPWHIHTLRQSKKAITPIFNHVTDRNPTTWDGMTKTGLDLHLNEKVSSIKQVWAVNYSIESNTFWFNIKFFLYHVLPLPLFVLAEYLARQPPRIKRVYVKMASVTSLSAKFTERNYLFSDKNTVNLWSRMSENDRRLFPLDVSDIDWKEFIRSCVKGGLMYLLGDKIRSEHPFKVRVMIVVDHLLRLAVKAFKIFILYKTVILVCNILRNFVTYEIERL